MRNVMKNQTDIQASSQVLLPAHETLTDGAKNHKGVLLRL